MFSHRALLVALAVSIAFHLAVLLSFGPRAPTGATQASAPLEARLGGLAKVPAVSERPLPPAPEPPVDALRRPRPDRKTAPAPSASPAAFPAARAPIVLPRDPDATEPARDDRVRTAIVATPATYGLEEQYTVPGADLPYAWSSAIDMPPQARSTREAVFPDGEHSSHLVLVRALLGTFGTIEALSVLCGEEPFVAASTRALAGWSFRPATSNGKPAGTWLLLEFAFLADNLAADFDPGRADEKLEAMRAQCALRLGRPR